MVKREYKTLIRTVEEKIMVSEKRYCDHCGKEITGRHFHVFTGRNDFEIFDDESVRDMDYCGIECLEQALRQYYIRADGEDANTEFIDITYMSTAYVKGENEYD